MNNKIKKIAKFFFKIFSSNIKAWLFLHFYYPSYFVIEPVNMCNIKCAACPWHTVMQREKRHLAFDEFMIIFNKIKKNAKNITLYQMGEPLLNKDLFKMIRVCQKHDIKTNFATNGMLIDKYLDEILTSDLSFIKIALDGMDKQTHEKYRVGSDFDKIINNIKLLKKERDNRGLKQPSIIIQTLVNRYNQNQLSDIAEFAKIYADKFLCKKMHLGRSQKLEQANQHFETTLGEYKRKNVKDEALYYKNMDICPQFNNVVILSNGHMVACCFDYDGQVSYGNLFKEPYTQVLKSECRKQFLKDYFKRKNSLCQQCDFMQGMLTFQF